LAPEQYYSVKNNPKNWCFCSQNEKEEGAQSCHEDGLMSIAPCWGGAPAFMSKPHFLDAPYYLNKTVGLTPDAEKHEMYFKIQPVS